MSDAPDIVLAMQCSSRWMRTRRTSPSSSIRRGQKWDRFRAGLFEIGFKNIRAANDDETTARVFIAARRVIQPVPPSAVDLELRDRWAEALVTSHDVRVAGVYVPVTGRKYDRKLRMWRHIHEAARARRDEPYVIVGDWNTGDDPVDKTHPRRPFKFAPQYRELGQHGYVEAWRHLHPDTADFSWYRHDQRGFRIDHAFVSSALLPRLRSARYSHDERVAGASDHSMLVVEFAD